MTLAPAKLPRLNFCSFFRPSVSLHISERLNVGRPHTYLQHPNLFLSLSLSLFVFFTDNLFLYILTFLCLTYWLAQSITIIPLPRYNFLYLHNPCHFGTNTNSFSLSLLNSLPSSLLLLSFSLKFIFSFSTKSLSFYHTRCPTLSGLLFTLPSLLNSILLQQFFSLSISHTLYCSFTPFLFLSLSLCLFYTLTFYTHLHIFSIFIQFLFLRPSF